MTLKEMPKLPVLRSLHWGAERLLKKAGFHCELRRSGELKLGVWRMSWAPSAHHRHHRTPRRFVFIPGFGDTPLSWLPVLTLLQPVLRKKFDELVFLDFPGFQGFLCHEKSCHSADLLLTAVFDALDSLQPHTLLGHSLGGWLAAHYAAACGAGQRPRKTGTRSQEYLGPQSIVLTAPFGVFTDEKMRLEWEAGFQKILEGGKEGFHHLRPRIFAKEPFWFRFIAPAFHDFIATEEINQFVGSFREEHLILPQLPNIRSKATIIWGDQDSFTSPKAAPLWLKNLTSTRHKPKTVLLKGIGHSPQIENTALTSAVLARVITGRDSGRGLEHHLTQRWVDVMTG